MVDPATANLWYFRMMFLALVAGVVFIRLIPLQTTPTGWAAPDLLICLCFAWVLRRPEYMPVLLIAVVMLITDLLFLRPPGLQATLIVLGAEFLRARTQFMRDLHFSFEWALVAGVMLVITLANQAALFLVMSPRPPIGLTLLQLLATVTAYPLVVLFSRYLLGVRKIVPGEVDALGHRL